MFVPVPPQSNQPAPQPAAQPDEAMDIDADAAANAEADEEAPELDIPVLRRPTVWPAVVRWARFCRVLAFVSLVICGLLAARNLYSAATNDPDLRPFMTPPVSSSAYLGYALVYAIVAVASCISLLGFAELLHVFLSIDAAVQRSRERRTPADQQEV